MDEMRAEGNAGASFSVLFPRAERAAAAPGEDGGLLIAGQWEQTLAGLDEDLEGEDWACVDATRRPWLRLPLWAHMGDFSPGDACGRTGRSVSKG